MVDRGNMNEKEGTYFQVNARVDRFSTTRWHSWVAKEPPSSNGAAAPFERRATLRLNSVLLSPRNWKGNKFEFMKQKIVNRGNGNRKEGTYLHVNARAMNWFDKGWLEL